MLGSLLCLCGAGLRDELDKQTRLVTLLGELAEKVRQAGGATRQVMGLGNTTRMSNLYLREPLKGLVDTLFYSQLFILYLLMVGMSC